MKVLTKEASKKKRERERDLARDLNAIIIALTKGVHTAHTHSSIHPVISLIPYPSSLSPSLSLDNPPR